MSSAERWSERESKRVTETSPRLFVTPRARRIARQHQLNLAQIRGSGPRGRIIAADVEPAPARNEDGIVSALRTTLRLASVETMLEAFAKEGLNIDFEDVMVRATSTALSAVRESHHGQPASVSLERTGGDVRFDRASTMSLSAIHAARLERSSTNLQPSGDALSIKILEAGGVTAVLMPPLPGSAMRLVLATEAGYVETSATLFFYESRVTPELATSLLKSFQQHLESPVLLLL
jgi:hypothetical protein